MPEIVHNTQVSLGRICIENIQYCKRRKRIVVENNDAGVKVRGLFQ